MGIDMDHLKPMVSSHTGDERKADRVIATERNQNTAMPHDQACRITHPSEIAAIVRSLDHDVTDIDHRYPTEMNAVALDVIPTERAILQRVAIRELLPRSVPRRSRSELLPRPITRLRRPTVKRHPKERDLRPHAVQIGRRRHAKERPSPTCKHLRHLHSPFGTQ